MKDVNLVKAIHKARSILELGEGYTEEPWKRAMDFLSKMAVAFYDLEPGRTFFPPAINPGPQRRINLYWSLQKFEVRSMLDFANRLSPPMIAPADIPAPKWKTSRLYSGTNI
jgi:hypothetical protein